MDSADNRDVRFEPEVWFAAFSPESSRRWVNWLSFGRFRHVSAFGWVSSAQCWLLFEVLSYRTEIRAVPKAFEAVALAPILDSCVVVQMPPVDRSDKGVKFKAGFWCVPSVAHLLGLRSCALRPDALYRQCLANGGRVMAGASDEIRERPLDRRAAENC